MEKPLYQFVKTRAERARLFFTMAAFCWFYVAGLWFYEQYGSQPIPQDFHLATVILFPIASFVLLSIGIWHRRHPATYRATITRDRFTVEYPGSEAWSFDVNVADIKRFENRQTLSHAGKGIRQHGLLMNDGQFHHITLNYGINIRDMYRAVKSVKPEVTFPSKVNLKTRGLGLDKDYDT